MSDPIYIKAAAYCARTEHCEQEVRQKLAAWQLPGASHDALIARLEEEKYLDNGRYARAYASDKFRFNRWGRYKIRMMLRAKAIDETLIDEALSRISDEAYDETIAELIRAYVAQRPGLAGYELRSRLLGYMASRGFEPERVCRQLDKQAYTTDSK